MKFITRFTTPLTTGFFIVSAISGVALFFHWVPNLFRAMHEWLSVVLLIPLVLIHLWKNWGAFVNYTRQGILFMALALSLVVALPFASSGMKSTGGNPAPKVMRLLMQAPLSDVAPVLKMTSEGLMLQLKDRGYVLDSSADSLDKVAKTANKEPMALLQEVMSLQAAPR